MGAPDEALTVYYDGDCSVCSKSMARLKRLDRGGRVRAVPFAGANLPAGITERDARRELHVVSSAGRIYRGWQAVSKLLRLSRRTWLVGAVGAVPPFRWLGAIGYRLFARHRYRFHSGCGSSCGPQARP